jgi:hypothetical protein
VAIQKTCFTYTLCGSRVKFVKQGKCGAFTQEFYPRALTVLSGKTSKSGN